VNAETFLWKEMMVRLVVTIFFLFLNYKCYMKITWFALNK